MNGPFSFHRRSNFLSQACLLLRTTKNPNPGYGGPSYGNRLFSNQSGRSVAGKPLIGRPSPLVPKPKPHCDPPPLSSHSHFPRNPNPKPDPNFDYNDFTTICDLLTSPSFPPGPALETALDRTGIELCLPLLQQIFDNFGSSPELLFSLFLWAERQPGYRSSAAIFNAMIKVLARAREFESAWSLILDRLKQPIEGPDMDTFAILIRRYARAGMPSPAIRTLEFACSIELIQNLNSELHLFEILLESFCKEGLVLEASEYFNRKRGIDPSWAPSIHVYNILLNGWFRSRQLECIEWVWDEMKKANVKPNVVTYGILVEGYCEMCHVEVAIELVGEMSREGIETNEIIYNPIIDALGEAGRFKEALGMMERFLVSESGPTISTYNSLVKSFCKAGDLEGANKILKMMISRGFLPSATTYNYFFRYFSRSGKIDEGLNLYTKMMESGFAPDRLTYHLLMKLLCKQERLDLAMQVRKEMKARGCDLHSAASTMLVHMLCEMHRFEDAIVEFEDIIRRGIIPQYVTYNKMTDELKKQGMSEMARKLYKMMVSVTHLMKLPNTYAGDEDTSPARRRSIVQKAKAMSETLKTCRNPRELVKRRSPSENSVSDVSVAHQLVEDIKGRIHLT